MTPFKFSFGQLSVDSIMGDFRQKIEQLQDLQLRKNEENIVLESDRSSIDQKISVNRDEVAKAERIQTKLREILES